MPVRQATRHVAFSAVFQFYMRPAGTRAGESLIRRGKKIDDSNPVP